MSVIQGPLRKWTHAISGWKDRWYVLDEDSGLLLVYTSKENLAQGIQHGQIRLKNAAVSIENEKDFGFTIMVDNKTLYFQARDLTDRERWVHAIEDAILKHKVRAFHQEQKYIPSIKDFDTRLSEADVYLQLMIDQTKAIEQKITNKESAEEISNYKDIVEHANNVLDKVKYTIAQLQITKNTAHPVNGIYQGPSNISTSNHSAGNDSLMDVETGIDVASDCANSLSQTPHSISTGCDGQLSAPPSHTSDDEEFEDACDFAYASSDEFRTDATVECTRKQSKVSTNESSEGATRRQSTHDVAVPSPDVNTSGESVTRASSKSAISVAGDETLDYDALYEASSDEDETMMESSHGSVITHLISQIKIGMDLTKVALPTFILERRSLLEMYADFFAHPDIFLRVTDIDNPRDRMLQVVKWYLTSYHAGRKGSVAKKPYNPIIGEVFQCHWDVPGTTAASTQAIQAASIEPQKPVPWAGPDQLVFVAEQVSHHPPISAFYSEHVAKRVSFSGHIYTKSKFLGLSVCVYNIGQGVLTLHARNNEQYIVTFPNGYGRSILTVPWVELGGTVKITCAQTGYYADIEFHTKPFYSNKRNRVTADVFAPHDKAAFVRITGEWNGVLEAKWTHSQASEHFVDIQQLAIIKKNVRPVMQQEENESRRLWREVTYGLRFNNIDKASSAKFELEQRQRDEAKLRKDANVTWQPKHFELNGQQWFYKNDLSKRLSSTTP